LFGLIASAGTATAGPITFNTFVTNGQLSTALGNTQVIGFTYAGNEFVGSLYPSDLRLYSTNLTGGNVQLFGTLPTGGGEVVVAASLGKAGFNSGDIYAGSSNDGRIYHFANAGGAPTLFATLPGGDTVKQVFFDPGNTFGGKMLVTTNQGDLYSVTSAGAATLLAAVAPGQVIEGLDITPASWGPLGGQVLVASESASTVYLVAPNGTVTPTGLFIPGAETVSTVPSAFLGNPVEGFYVANFPNNIQKADPSQFAGLGDTVIVSNEFSGSNPQLYDVSYNGSGLSVTPLTVTNPLSQFEDGIFVTAERVGDLSTTPEPASMTLLLIGSASLGFAAWRRCKDPGG
jgi:hypothetical protein